MKAKSIEPLVVSAIEAAEMLRTGVHVVYPLIERGEIPAYRVGCNWKVPITKLQLRDRHFPVASYSVCRDFSPFNQWIHNVYSRPEHFCCFNSRYNERLYRFCFHNDSPFLFLTFKGKRSSRGSYSANKFPSRSQY